MQRSTVLTAFQRAAAVFLAAIMIPAGWAQNASPVPSAPSAQMQTQKAVPSSSQPFDVKEYSKPQSSFPNPLAPYTARHVAPPNLANTPRIDQLMHDGKLYISMNDAVALALENNLIKQRKPRFNILLRDDKTYPYVKVTLQEPYPRVFVTRRLLNDGARYFGPYTDVGAMRRALNLVKRIFTVRSCSWDMPNQMPERACLDYYIKRCKGPCIFAQSLEDYRAMIEEVVVFLDGRTDEVVRRVTARMNAASEAMDYERAAELRDAIKLLQTQSN